MLYILYQLLFDKLSIRMATPCLCQAQDSCDETILHDGVHVLVPCQP